MKMFLVKSQKMMIKDDYQPQYNFNILAENADGAKEIAIKKFKDMLFKVETSQEISEDAFKDHLDLEEVAALRDVLCDVLKKSNDVMKSAINGDIIIKEVEGNCSLCILGAVVEENDEWKEEIEKQMVIMNAEIARLRADD